MNVKKSIALIMAIGILSAGGAAFAAVSTPADIAAGLTGKSVAQVNQERAEGKAYGTIAKDAGKLEEFQKQMLAQKKTILDQRVKDGTITQQQADLIYENIKDNQADCQGTGTGRMGRRNGAGFGQGQCGLGFGQGGCGQGLGLGFGRGN
ncbi:MAG TPA: DUF2680 domain-containing protein [Bacillota bacterium]|nr:DUF2680 domain-containing protein [Bacillota bacterium]